jgi:hypothetical protein
MSGRSFSGAARVIGARKPSRASQFTAIGAFRTATIGYFDRERQNYIKLPIGKQVEVLKGFVAAVAERRDLKGALSLTAKIKDNYSELRRTRYPQRR